MRNKRSKQDILLVFVQINGIYIGHDNNAKSLNEYESYDVNIMLI